MCIRFVFCTIHLTKKKHQLEWIGWMKTFRSFIIRMQNYDPFSLNGLRSPDIVVVVVVFLWKKKRYWWLFSSLVIQQRSHLLKLKYNRIPKFKPGLTNLIRIGSLVPHHNGWFNEFDCNFWTIDFLQFSLHVIFIPKCMFGIFV